MIGPMKRPLFLLVLVCQFALGQNFSQILSGFIVPDGAQDFESVAESAGVAMPLSIYTTCQNREFYIWNGLKASTVNGLVKNLDSRIREASWQIISTETKDNQIIRIGKQNGATLAVGIATGGKLSDLWVMLLLCEVPSN